MRITIIWKETKIKKFHHFFKKKKYLKLWDGKKLKDQFLQLPKLTIIFLGVLPGEFANLLLCS